MNSKAPNSRWYSGSGIYRSVNLWSGEKSHILPEGVQVTTVSTAPALIDVKTNTVNDENMCISHVDIVGYNYGQNLYEGTLIMEEYWQWYRVQKKVELSK